jgi:EMAP domain
VGKVLECIKVPNADKLLQFKLDDGLGGRTILSGIAKFYQPEDLIGKNLCFIANLVPRKIRGIESQGMILSAEQPDGTLKVIEAAADIVPGSAIG